MNDPVQIFDFKGTKVEGVKVSDEIWFRFSDILKAFNLKTLDTEIIEELVEEDLIDMFEIITDGTDKVLALFILSLGVFRLAYESETPIARRLRRIISETMDEYRKAKELNKNTRREELNE